jgi:hypothetical protein
VGGKGMQSEQFDPPTTTTGKNNNDLLIHTFAVKWHCPSVLQTPEKGLSMTHPFFRNYLLKHDR